MALPYALQTLVPRSMTQPRTVAVRIIQVIGGFMYMAPSSGMPHVDNRVLRPSLHRGISHSRVQASGVAGCSVVHKFCRLKPGKTAAHGAAIHRVRLQISSRDSEGSYNFPGSHYLIPSDIRGVRQGVLRFLGLHTVNLYKSTICRFQCIFVSQVLLFSCQYSKRNIICSTF